ncbi:Methylated-DNA--protein-cysteine methyltransferase [compost metagenome]|uniref:methylated-DNA--[protein]-cysteine S-methyltransferase n=1 Tax=Pseudomonas TaxID=286 RepID=UPI000412AC94|nr:MULTISPECIES: methylated-DNA--[protein]-cysteine S-methyltransferase [Pseudomonas]MCW2271220.1 methylated-DNA-[protein]-cysteine S-methyltransferase [Pseudomonas sp. JUb96]PRA58163.1 methylated-DNA--[protein]-cysteine S-methyltransferase [Pseudomonas sp. MYb187]
MSPAELLLYRLTLPAPIGQVLIVSNGHELVGLEFDEPEIRLLRLLHTRFGSGLRLRETADLAPFSTPVQDYFAGDLHALDALAVAAGGTAFQQRVWTALRQIPTGTTRTYGQIAVAIGSPSAARAVGLANALNPISLAIPCHRVIGSAGSLTGYGGGIERKRWLLEHERRGCP